MSVVEEEVVTYVMPEVKRGKLVEYFEYGRENPIPKQALVAEVWAGQIDLILQDGKRFKDSVHHKDDPRLATHPEWKTHGTWDYTPEEKQQKAEVTMTRARMAELGRQVTALQDEVAELCARLHAETTQRNLALTELEKRIADKKPATEKK